MSTFKWKIFCLTESAFIEGLGTSAPTACYNDIGHSVNPNSVRQIEVYEESNTTSLVIAKDPGIPGTGNITIQGNLILQEQSTPSNPSLNHHILFFDSSDSKIKSINSGGTVLTLNPVTTKGDLISSNGSIPTRVPAGTNSYILVADSTQSSGLKWEDPNTTADIYTASNVGTGGVGVFDTKSGLDFQFKNINTGSSKVTITDDTGNNEIDIDISEGNIIHQNLSGSGTNTHAQIDSHISSTSNPHSVSLDQITPTTTKGDLLVENGSTVIRLPIGSDGKILRSDSSQSSGMLWTTGGINDGKVRVSANDISPDNLIEKIITTSRSGLTISQVNDAADETLQFDLTSQIKAPDGTTSTPTYTFDSDPNTGMYRESGGDLAFTQDGVCVLEIEAGASKRVFISNQVPNYETLVTTNQTLTNKKYVDNAVNAVTIDTVTPTTTKGDILVENGSNLERLGVGSNNYVLTADSTQTSGVKWAPSGEGKNIVSIIQDEKSTGTNGGTFQSGSWRTRTLNTIYGNGDSYISLSSNQITLQSGKYYIEARAPAYSVSSHRIKLYNITDSSNEILGSSSDTKSGSDHNHAFLIGYINITSPKVFEIQHRCESTDNSDGFGRSTGWDTEVYTIVNIFFLEPN